MAGRRVELARAFVLHRRPYRESSVLVEAFSVDHGRVGLVARGARRPSSRLRGALQPFRPLLLSWSGRGELATLTGAESERTGPTLSGGRLASGFYVNELLLRLLPRHDPHPELFETYHSILEHLALTDAHEPALRVFEKRLLAAIGYGLLLDREAGSGRAIDPAVLYRYNSEEGPVADSGENGPGVPVHGRTLIALEREELDDRQVSREAKRLMRKVLAVYLGSKPLASRALFR